MIGVSCSQDRSRPAWAAAGQGRADPAPAPLRILIVEDEVLIAMMLESVVEELGFEVSGVAVAGAEAVSLAMRSKPDLILMDVCLIGEMDGVEAARQARAATGARIVFVTAYGGGEMLERIKAAVPGAPVLSKPVSPADLLQAIDRSASH